MPVTKTAHRALRGSLKKAIVNKAISKNLEVAVRLAKRTKSQEKVLKAISLSDRAVKKRVIHKNKAARIKAQLSKFLSQKPAKPKRNIKSKTSKRK